MKTSLFLSFILIGIFFVSCSKIPIYQSKSYIQTEKREFLHSLSNNYDEKTSVRYGIANNDTNFYIQAVFSDRASFMKIMRGGLTVYFDPEGKKKKDYKLKIEKTDQQKMDISSLAKQLGGPQGGERQNMPATISTLYKKVTWDKNGKEFVFYRNLLKDPISVELIPTEQNELILDIKMPLSEIPLLEGQNLFSLGIETGSVSSGGMSGGRPGGGMSRSGGMGGRGGGGMKGGGGGRGGAGGGGGGMRSAGSSGSSSGMEPVRIWFQVQL